MDKLTDLSFMESFTKGDTAKIKKYITMFLQMAPGQLTSIQDKLGAKDWPALRTAAHSFKPQLNYMGIASLKDVILKIEHNANEEENLEELPAMVENLVETTQKAMVELEEHVKNL